jgi:hypothetical protein
LRHRFAVRRWRIKFFIGYVIAIAQHRNAAATLLSSVERAFDDPWGSRETLEFCAATPMRNGQFPIDARVVFSIWHKEQRALVMTGYFSQQMLVHKTASRGSRFAYPARFGLAKPLAACQELARKPKNATCYA